MIKSTHKNYFKPLYLIIIVFCMLILMSNSVSAEDLFEFDNYKSFDENIGKYGKISILDKSLFGEDSLLQEVELKTNTEICLSNNCKATKQIIMHEKGILISDVRFIEIKNNKKHRIVNIKEYNFYILNGNEKYIYNLGDEVDAGTYDVEFEGKLKPFQTVDWQIKLRDSFWIEEWAVWTDSIQVGLQAYYDFETGTGTTAIDRFSGNYPGTLTDGASWNSTSCISGNCLQLDGTNDFMNISIQPGDAITGMNNWTFNYWYNMKNHDANWYNTAQKLGGNIWQDAGGALIEMRIFDAEGDFIRCNVGAGTIAGRNIWDNDPQWKMITYTWNGSISPHSIRIYHNSTYLPCETAGGTGVFSGNLVDSSVDITVGRGDTNAWGGQFDEYGIWERELSQSEITDLYNAGVGIFFRMGIILDSPLNDTSSTDSPQNFTAIITPDGGNSLANATLFAWDSIGTIVNQTTIQLEGIVANTSNFSISNLPAEVLMWNVLGCFNDSSDVTCEFAEENFTLNYGLKEVFERFNGTVIETSNQKFTLNLDIISGFNIQRASLIYNNTIFSSATITSSGTNFNISRVITIPQGSQGFSTENRTFKFNVSLVNDISGTTTHFLIGENEQKINELSFGFCDGGDLDVPMLNFTMINELTDVELNASKNATTFQATFLLGSNSENLIKNLSFSNISTNVSRFNFCTTETTNVFTINMNAFYTANGFVDKNHFLTGATLSSNTNEINLFMMPESVGVEFFIDVEQDLFPLTEATINIAKLFVGEGVFKTTEIDVTDGDGRITAFLDLNKDYRFTIVKDGVLLAIQEKRAICEAAPCTLTLSITGDTPDVYSGFSDIFAQQVLYNLSYDPSIKRVTFDFVDITGLATSFRMDIRKGLTNGTGELISTQTLFTSSGSMTFNHTETSGDFTANILISRSPNQLIDYLKYIINDNAVVLGILGLFVAFLIVITVIFGFAFHPPMLIMSIPLALSLVKLMGIISISNGGIIVIYLLAMVAITFISR